MSKQLKIILGIGFLAGWLALPSALAEERPENKRQEHLQYAEGLAAKAQTVREEGVAAEKDIDVKKEAVSNAKHEREPVYKRAVQPVRGVINKIRAKRIDSRNRKISRKETELTRKEQALLDAENDLNATKEEAEVSGARGKLGEKLEKKHNKARAKRIKKAQKKYDKAQKKRDKVKDKIASLKDKNTTASEKVKAYADSRERAKQVESNIKAKRGELAASRKAFNEMKPRLSAAEKIEAYSKRIAVLEDNRKDAVHNLSLPFSEAERNDIRKYKADVEGELDGLLDEVALLHPVLDPKAVVARSAGDARVNGTTVSQPSPKEIVDPTPQIIQGESDATVASDLQRRISEREAQLRADQFYHPDTERDGAAQAEISEMRSQLTSGSARSVNTRKGPL